MSQKASAWALLYELAQIPWDLGRPHPELILRLETDPNLGTGRQGRVLVPGCGLGHDAAALAGAGWHVTALDFAPSLAPRLEGKLGSDGAFVCADAFTYEPDQPFDVVFDHTFFCAVPPPQRNELGERFDRWLSDDGRLMSLVFPIGRDECLAGPPHAMDVGDIAQALGPGFELLDDEPAADDGRSWATRWAVFGRV